VRSFAEIQFRLRQEIANLILFARPPELPASQGFDVADIAPPSFWPITPGDIERVAERVCAHKFSILGYDIETGPDIRWRRDYVRGIESGLEYFRKIPYLDAARAGDHKVVWELNRHQHLAVLALARRQSGRREFLTEIPLQISSWLDQNPFMRGINWASALEVAFRALSWLWIELLEGPDLPPDFRRRMWNSLYRHGNYLERNLSVYFSPNTHLLGEAVALHLLGVAFPKWPRASQWQQRGAEIVASEITRQVRPDGSHFEQSSAYHVYALDMFLLHAQFAPVSEDYRARLRLMREYLAALTSDDGSLPLLGDDDGGHLFFPCGSQRNPHVGQPFSLPASPNPANSPVLFPDAGVAVLSHQPAHIVVDTRAFGHGGAGHSHAHALSVVFRYKGRDILIDPGTYTYTGEPEWRARFRGTALHNTVRTDELDQARGTGPFRWEDKPVTQILNWMPGTEWTYLHAACSYRGLRHDRHFVWVAASEILAVVDVVTGAGRHKIEQFWHLGDGMDHAVALPAGTRSETSEGGEFGWYSEVPGSKVPARVIRVERVTELPAVLAAIIAPRSESALEFTLESGESGIVLRGPDGRSIELDTASLHERKIPRVFWPVG
jgi:hypothetical protein